MKVYKKKDLIMKGVRNKRDGLWDIPIHEHIIDYNFKWPKTHSALYLQNKNRNHSTSPIAFMKKYHTATAETITEQQHHNIHKFLAAMKPIIKPNSTDAII